MGYSHATNKRAVREVEVHISPSSKRVRNSTRKLQLFAVAAQRSAHNLGPFPAFQRDNQDTDIIYYYYHYATQKSY